jgi:Zn-dependent peptidase ImmA (M78 family)
MAFVLSGPSEVRQQHCRKAAHDLLKQLLIGAPEEIDLEALAYKAGKLVIEEGGLDTSEGRLVTSPGKGGSIRVKQGLDPGRRRFTIAHEIGHYVLHPLIPHNRQHTKADLTIWHDASEEAEANIFAAELLMPEFLFKPRTRRSAPSLALLDTLATDFKTSMMATAFQYVHYTNEQVALVVSKADRILWSKRSKDFWPRIQRGTLHSHSAAGERLAGKALDSGKMVRAPVYAWLTGFEKDRDHDIMEDSRLLDYYDRTITLLWIKDDLNDGK